MATFAEQLAAARKAAGMTQEELSDAVHVARNTISNWERGQRQPDLGTLRLLGQVLHTDFLSGDEAKNEATAGAGAAVGQKAKRGKTKLLAVILAIAVVLAAGVALWFTLGNKKPSSYQPAAKLADEAGQLTIEFFRKPVRQTGGMPYLTFSYDSAIETDDGQDVWFYTFRFRETNGYPFKINSAVVYSFPPNDSFTDAFSPQRLAEYGMASEIPAYGEWSEEGGLPVQPYRGVAIILYGEDGHGTEMEFHGYIDYSASSPADRQE